MPPITSPQDIGEFAVQRLNEALAAKKRESDTFTVEELRRFVRSTARQTAEQLWPQLKRTDFFSIDATGEKQ